MLFSYILFRCLRVVAAKLLIMAEHDTTLLLNMRVRRGQQKGENVIGVSSSIRDQFNDTDHIGSFDNSSILDKASNEFDVLLHGRLLIRRVCPRDNQ